MNLPTPMWSNELLMELVARIDEPEEILERHGATQADLKLWMCDPVFVHQYKENKAFWSSNTNMRGRIEQKALAALEDSLLGLFAIANNADTIASARLDAIAKIAKFAKADGGEKVTESKGGSGGPQVKISINLGEQTIEKTITTDVVAHDDDMMLEDLNKSLEHEDD
jgi:hypothetical protein